MSATTLSRLGRIAGSLVLALAASAGCQPPDDESDASASRDTVSSDSGPSNDTAPPSDTGPEADAVPPPDVEPPGDATDAVDTRDTSDAADGADGGSAQSVEFQLTNSAERKLYVTSRVDCARDGWVRLRRGEEKLRGAIDCHQCTCEEVETGECARCGKPCSSGLIQTLEPGSSLEWTWEGRLYEEAEAEGKTCYRPSRPPVGETIDARFCWYDYQSEVGDLLARSCETVSLEYGARSTVTHEVTEVGDPGPKTFELSNRTGSSIRVQKSRGCRGAAWVRSPSEDYAFNTGCPCMCDVLETQSVCPSCACSPPEVAELGAGESLTWDWNGVLFVPSMRKDQSCKETTIPERSRELKVEFCWSTDSGPTGTDTQLESTTCSTETFQPSDDRSTIRHELE